MAYKQRKPLKRTKRKWPYAATAAALVVVVGGFLLFSKFHNSPVVAPTGPETKGETSASSKGVAASSSSAADNAAGQDKSNASGSPAGTPPVAPIGNFVSDHHPNLSGSPAPNQMASACTTTPGASCQISFTMSGTTKSLPAKTTDAQGAAYWSWTLQSAGLTQGTWTVKAVATLNGASSTATDAQGLVVAP